MEKRQNFEKFKTTFLLIAFFGCLVFAWLTSNSGYIKVEIVLKFTKNEKNYDR